MNVQRSGLAASMLLFGGMIAPVFADARPDVRPNGRGDVIHGHQKAATGGAVVQGNGISYHNGPVIHGTTNVYYIWYGDWSQDSSANAILTDFASNVGGSPYFNINTTYGDTTANVTNSVHYAGSSTDSGSLGTSLNDNSIWSIVTSAISSGKLPLDGNAVYFVLTAPGVAETTGFLTQYCGWHTYGTYNGTNVKFSFVGDAKGPSLGSCAIQTSGSPNGDPSADAMASVIAHELEESVSDPLLNAWYDSTGAENADKCAWTFGTEYPAGGGVANMKLGTRDFLIQQNWLNANGGACALSYASAPDFSVSVSPSSQSILQGATTGTYTASASPIGGFTGTVNWTMSTPPAGITASAISSSGTFTLAASTTVAPGTYSVTITGTSGSLVHTATASVVVTSNANFTLGVTPASQTIKRPGSTSFSITVAPSGTFSSTVSLSVSGQKTGITTSLGSSSMPNGSGTTTLTVTATQAAKRGTRSLTITASGGGIVHSTNIAVSIQ
jgi:phosphate-induced protein 1